MKARTETLTVQYLDHEDGTVRCCLIETDGATFNGEGPNDMTARSVAYSLAAEYAARRGQAISLNPEGIDARATLGFDQPKDDE